jgi:OPA family glycerol-3-phosphate transporter-like MFS transporter
MLTSAAPEGGKASTLRRMSARRERAIVIATLLLGYAAFYLCRANLDAAQPLLITTFGYTKSQLGAVASISVLSYAIGKVVLGFLGDAIGGKRIMLVAIGGSVAATFLIGASSGSLMALTTLAIANRFFQAGGWGGLVHVVSRWFPKEQHGTVMGALSTSYEVGNLLTLLFCGAVVRAGFGWRALFLLNPAIFLLMGLGLALVLRGEPRYAQQTTGAAPYRDGDVTNRPPKVPLSEALPWLARKPSFWIAVVLSMLLTFIRTGFNTWTPTYLFEVGKRAGDDAAVSAAMVKSAIFPAAGMIGALVVGRISDRFGPGRRAPVMAASLFVLCGAIFVLAHTGITSVRAASLSIGACGLFLLGPYSLLGGAVTLDVASTRAASTAAGIIDGVGYLGASLAGVVLGSVAQRWGWSRAFDIIGGAAFVATLVSAAWAWSLRARQGTRRIA